MTSNSGLVVLLSCRYYTVDAIRLFSHNPQVEYYWLQWIGVCHNPSSNCGFFNLAIMKSDHISKIVTASSTLTIQLFMFRRLIRFPPPTRAMRFVVELHTPQVMDNGNRSPANGRKQSVQIISHRFPHNPPAGSQRCKITIHRPSTEGKSEKRKQECPSTLCAHLSASAPICIATAAGASQTLSGLLFCSSCLSINHPRTHTASRRAIFNTCLGGLLPSFFFLLCTLFFLLYHRQKDIHSNI